MTAFARNPSAITERNDRLRVAEMLKDPLPGVSQMLQAFRPVLEREVFLLGGARGPIRRWPLADFLDGLETVDLRSMVDATRAGEKSLAQR